MIPDSEQWGDKDAPVQFRDADGCRLFPGANAWTSDPYLLDTVDGRLSHVPFRLGCVGQFEFAFECYALEIDSEMEWEEAGDVESWGGLDLGSLALDPVIGPLAREQLDRYPGDEIAFEVDDIVGPLDRFTQPSPPGA